MVRNAAVAVNVIDWRIQSSGDLMFTHLKYPFVLGFDTAGEVVNVGEGVKRFDVGDRVVGYCRGCEPSINSPAEGAFQHYTVLREDLASPIPADMPYKHAAVLPLGLATASSALFDKAQLGLEWPTEPRRAATGKTVLIWGGSTSIGCNAVQLAVAAGYEVFSTASPKNFDLVRKLGAVQVWDYHSASVEEDIVTALRDKSLAGAVCIGAGAAEHCLRILARSNGTRFAAMVSFPVPEQRPQNFAVLRTVAMFASSLLRYRLWWDMVKGVKSKLVLIQPIFEAGIARHIFAEFLPKALSSGSFVPAPDALVVGQGLEHIQKALDLQMKGVSAKKLVVTF